MLILHILYFFICLSREFIKATNGLVMNPEEGKRFLCVWLLFYAKYFLVLMVTGIIRIDETLLVPTLYFLQSSICSSKLVQHLSAIIIHIFRNIQGQWAKDSLMWCSRISKKRVKKWSNSSKQ